MRMLVTLLLFASLVGCSSEADLGEEWIAITEDDFPLAFAPDQMQGAVSRHLKSTRYRNGRATLTHRASWKAASVRLPRAALRLEQYGPGFVIAQSAETTLDRSVANIFEGRRPLILTGGRDVNVLGAIDYLLVRDGDAECLVFYQSWRRDRILNILVGHYCDTLTPGLSNTRITALLRSLKPK